MKKISIVVFAICIFGMSGIAGTSVFAMGSRPPVQESEQKEETSSQAGTQLEEMKENVDQARKIIIARVNGSEISMYSLIRSMNKIAPQYVKGGENVTPEITAKVKKEALDQLIYQELAIQKSIEKGIKIEPETVEKVVSRVKKGLETEEAYKAYLEKFGFTEETFKDQIERGHRYEIITREEIYAKVKVDPKKIKAEYEKYKKEGKLRMAEDFVVKDVLLMKGENDSATQKRAEELNEEIKKLDYDFGQLVLDGSFITRRMKVAKERNPEIYKKMVAMKVGETSGVVKDKDSYHIFKVLKKDAARDQTLEEAEGFIENRLRVPAQNERMAKFAEELKKNAKVEILLDKVEQEFKESAANGKDDSHS